MDLVSFRNRLAQRSGVTLHEGIGISPANADARGYLESPVPVANRSLDTENKISMRSEKRGNAQGRYYDDEVDLVDPNNLVDEALDRGFGGKGKGGDDSDDEISREKKAASKKYYGIGRGQGGEGGDYDDVAETKRRNKADAQRSQKSASNKSASDGKQSEQHYEEPYNSRAESQRLSSMYSKNVDHEGHASSQGSVGPDLNWNMDSTHVKKEKTFSEATGVYSSAQHDQVQHSANYNQQSGKHDQHSVRTGGKEEAFSDAAGVYSHETHHSEQQQGRQSHGKQDSRKSAQSSKKEVEEEDDSPFLPPILPKKPKQQPKFVVQSREIATQITADALVPAQVVPDYWISKDTTINRQYDDLALRRANIQTGQTQMSQQQQSRLEYDNRPMTYRSTFTDYEPPTEAQQGFEFEAISDEEQGDVYSRLNDGKTYQKDAGTDLWMQKTDISFTVLLYLKKNLGINWKRAGQYLGVSRERLRRIEDVGIANARTGIEKMAQDMLFEWAEKDPQPTVAKLCAALEAADLSKLSQGVMEKVQKEKSSPTKRRKAKKAAKGRKVDDAIKVPISEETIPYRVMVYLKDNLGESWKDLAVCLKIPSPKIKAIEAEAWQVEKMAYDMLHEWRQRDKEAATVDRLIEALEKAQCKKLVKGVAARSQSYHFRIAA